MIMQVYCSPLSAPSLLSTAAEADHFTFDTEKSYEKLDYIFYNPAFIQAVQSQYYT